MAALLRNYADDQEKIKFFLSEKDYIVQVMNLSSKEKSSIEINLEDVHHFDAELCSLVMNNAKRYLDLFSNAIFDLLPTKMVEDDMKKDCLDIYIEQRFFQHQKHADNVMEPTDFFSRLPKALIRRFEVHFNMPFTMYKPISVRQLKASAIGQLVNIKGIVTRISEVKPLLLCATYTCDQCGSETFQPLNGSGSFVPLEKCVSEDCRQKNASGRLYFQTRASRFVKYQELKIQEHSDQVPVGNIPRSLLVHAQGDLTRQVLPGDHVAVTGVFLPTLKVGFKQMTGGLISETYLDAHRIQKMDRNEDGGDSQTESEEILKAEEWEELSYRFGRNILDKFSKSIAPEIYGHEDLKKALLCLLAGGVDRDAQGMKIRGNINICMFGDPGVAKSQLLGFINRVSSRSQYTTGRGSSGVGLTASVSKDQITGEMVLEGGALVLADKGICCIDEFDKMAETDKVAIHEVMEQQTISIAKAGILTTLNARVSILAAANPIFGRYNLKKSIQQNIELSAALLSRFDLIWLITDTPDSDFDRRLAQHITEVHMTEREVPTDQEEDAVDMKLLRRYIATCKKVSHPTIPESLKDKIVTGYIHMREEARNNKHLTTFTSARTLLAILRLSTALARLRMAKVVEAEDVDGAYRLIEKSKETLNQQMKESEMTAHRFEKIFQIIRESVNEEREVLFEEVLEKCLDRGYTESDLEETIENYEDFVAKSVDKTKILLV